MCVAEVKVERTTKFNVKADVKVCIYLKLNILKDILGIFSIH